MSRIRNKIKGLNGAMACDNFSGFRDFREWRGNRDMVQRVASASGAGPGDLPDDLADPDRRKAIRYQLLLFSRHRAGYGF